MAKIVMGKVPKSNAQIICFLSCSVLTVEMKTEKNKSGSTKSITTGTAATRSLNRLHESYLDLEKVELDVFSLVVRGFKLPKSAESEKK